VDLRPLGPHQLTHEAGDSEVSSHVFLDAFADDARERAAVVGDALRFVAAVHVDAARLLPPAPTRTASAISLDLDSHDGAAVEALPRPVLALHARVEVRRPTARGSRCDGHDVHRSTRTARNQRTGGEGAAVSRGGLRVDRLVDGSMGRF
jgi:hypothetical protein